MRTKVCVICSSLEVFILKLCFYSESAGTHHGRHDPADVNGVASVQVVHSSVLLVLRADLEQIQTCLQHTKLILYKQRQKKREE